MLILGAPWTEAEDDILRTYYPEKVRLTAAIPHRTWTAIKRRASYIGVTKSLQTWTGRECQDLLRAYARKASPRELRRLFPHRSYEQIFHKAVQLGAPRQPQTLLKTEIPVLHSIRHRARDCGMSLSSLSKAVGRSNSFGQVDSKPANEVLAKAIAILGGEITIVWDD